MADQVVTDAAIQPSDEGLPNIADGNESWNSAGLQMLLGQAVQSGSYARSDSELQFTNHDGANDQVDVTAGVAYLALAGETVDVQSVLGGSAAPAYDTTITANLMPAICVVVPSTQADLAVQAGTLSQVWLAYATDGTVTGVSAGDVYLRSDDTGSVTAPPHPSVELGSANPDDATADTLANRFGSPTFDKTTATTTVTGQVDNDDYHEKVVTQSGSTGSLDLSAANVFEQTVTGNITFSFNNPEGTPAGNSFLLIVIQDGTGGHTLSWPAAVEWGGGSAPGVSTAANDKHIFSFVSPDGGTTWYGFVAAENVA